MWADHDYDNHYVQVGLEVLRIDDATFKAHYADLTAAREAEQKARTERVAAIKASETETRERTEYLRLQAKYGTEGAQS